MVVQDRGETWFKDSKDEREQRVFTMLDQDPDEAMPNTFDYRLSEEEAAQHPSGSMSMKMVTLSVRDWKPGKGGRMIAVGRIFQNGNVKPSAVVK